MIFFGGGVLISLIFINHKVVQWRTMNASQLHFGFIFWAPGKFRGVKRVFSETTRLWVEWKKNADEKRWIMSM